MEESGLRDQLHHRGLRLISLLYSTTTCKIYLSFNENRHENVVLKVQMCSELIFNRTSEEANLQMRLEHPSVIKLYDYFWYWVSDKYRVLVLEMEMMSHDMAVDITNRRKNAYPYTENELWSVLHSMTDVLEYAQTMGISHRDIKPANIMKGNESVKLGDFGSAKRICDVEMSTLVGTPLYLSPLLRLGLMQRVSVVRHNAYKSDVYSLGMTILHMANLELSVAVNSSGKLQEIIARVNYSDSLKNMLVWMLMEDEEQRPDFIHLKAYLSGQSAPVNVVSECEELVFTLNSSPQICENPVELPKIADLMEEKHCEKCRLPGNSDLILMKESEETQVFYHPKCLSEVLDAQDSTWGKIAKFAHLAANFQ